MTNVEAAATFLRDAANYFRTALPDNLHMKEQLEEKIALCERLAVLVEENPLGIIGDE